MGFKKLHRADKVELACLEDRQKYKIMLNFT